MTYTESNNNVGETNLSKYLFLFIIYLIAVISSSISNSVNIDVQLLYRIPFINIRWIDVIILFIVCSTLYNLFTKPRSLTNTNFVVRLGFIYLIYELIQLIRSWGIMDVTTQLSLFVCTLSLFIVIDLSMYVVPISNIVNLLKKFSIYGAVIIILSNSYLLYSFFSGHVVFEDDDARAVLDIEGSKETVYSFVLVPFVYAFGLYSIQKAEKFLEKALFLVAILSIYGALIITYWRGTLVMLLIITIYFLLSSSNIRQILLKFSVGAICVCLFYFIAGDALAKRGFDPVKRLVETAKFTTDVNNPDWDKGRIVAQQFAINEWQKNIWFGAGYDALGNGKPMPPNSINPHNGIITSLFHRGVIGTIILLFLYGLLFKYAINCWVLLKAKHTYEDDIIKLLLLVSFFWIITFLTQEALWEKYSLSIEFLYLGLIVNIYKQKTT